jgi:integrase/recombinase XerD
MEKDKVYNNFYNGVIYEKVNPLNKELLDDFLLEMKQNKKSGGTIYQYERDIKGLFCWVYQFASNKYILELNKKDFRRYSLYLTEECKVSNARHNRLLSSLRSMLTFAEENDDDYEYITNVAKKVKGLPKESVREIFFLTDDQIMKLKDELWQRQEYQKAALLALAYDSCARKNELAQVEKFSFFDEKKSNTNKVIGKRRKTFSLVYFSLTKQCAKLWLEQRDQDDISSMWVVGDGKDKKPATPDNIYEWFVNMRKILAEIEGKEIDFNVHSLRHTGLQNLSEGSHYICKELKMEKGFPIEKLRLLANHTDISTTSSYLKDNSIDELEEMFNIKIE